jgi:hypothetical protein
MAGLAAISFSNGLASPQPLTFTSVKVAPAVKLLADLEGKWEFIMTPPEREPISGILSVKRGSGPAGYVGSILVNELQQESQTKITKAEVNGEKFLYAGEVVLNSESYVFEMTGTIKGNKMEGQTKVQEPNGSIVYKLEAKRK